ncbi:MAG: PD-(D/E)XK nuclease family protein [Treponema sp.]|nr:PD-(D/E)XK nuclease family protein [Treponema sp.]
MVENKKESLHFIASYGIINYMDKKNIETMFQEIQPIVEKNKQLRSERELKGEFFNLFSILKVERDEIHTHSTFLAELLNPSGSHGNKEKFLKLFIQQMHLQNINKDELNAETAIVKKEKYIGQKDVKNETGGNIDILIKFEKPKYLIIIENKIDAGDQEAQLARYHNYAKQHGNAFTLFYLTKDGHEPTEWSIGKDKDEHYWNCISYKNDIKQWLKKCLQISTNQELVNSSIKQYISLINKITGQEFDNTMQKEMLEKMLQHNEEMLAIWENLDNWQYSIVENVIKEVAAETDCECIRYDENSPWWIWDNDYWVAFIPRNAKYCKIWFGNEKYEEPYYYLEKEGVKTSQKKLECMKDEANDIIPYGSNYLEDKYKKWNINLAKDIINGEFKNYLKKCINDILNDPNFPK